MHKMDKLARYFPKVENSKSFSRKKLWQNKIGTFHLKHPVLLWSLPPFFDPLNPKMTMKNSENLILMPKNDENGYIGPF